MVQVRRINRLQKLKESQDLKYKTILLHEQGIVKQEVYNGIQVFEDNLVRLGIDVTKDPDQPKKKKQQSTFSAEATMIKIKERTKQRKINQKEREKRRRKMMVDQKKAQD